MHGPDKPHKRRQLVCTTAETLGREAAPRPSRRGPCKTRGLIRTWYGLMVLDGIRVRGRAGEMRVCPYAPPGPWRRNC